MNNKIKIENLLKEHVAQVPSVVQVLQRIRYPKNTNFSPEFSRLLTQEFQKHCEQNPNKPKKLVLANFVKAISMQLLYAKSRDH